MANDGQLTRVEELEHRDKNTENRDAVSVSSFHERPSSYERPSFHEQPSVNESANPTLQSRDIQSRDLQSKDIQAGDMQARDVKARYTDPGSIPFYPDRQRAILQFLSGESAMVTPHAGMLNGAELGHCLSEHARKAGDYHVTIADGDGGDAALDRMIKSEIVPRLMMLYKDGTTDHSISDNAFSLTEADHENFRATLIHSGGAAAHKQVVDFLNQGLSRKSLFLDLLSSAARDLGADWDADRLDFSDVTVGLCRLHEILRVHASANTIAVDRSGLPGWDEALIDDHPVRDRRKIDQTRGKNKKSLRPTHSPKRILLATPAGEQHIFGLSIAAEMFRAAGWFAAIEPGSAQSTTQRALREKAFDVLGFSATGRVSIAGLAEEIRNLRAVSQNQDIRVIVGGHFVFEHADISSGHKDLERLADKIGADLVLACASDAPSACELMLAGSGARC